MARTLEAWLFVLVRCMYYFQHFLIPMSSYEILNLIVMIWPPTRKLSDREKLKTLKTVFSKNVFWPFFIDQTVIKCSISDTFHSFQNMPVTFWFINNQITHPYKAISIIEASYDPMPSRIAQSVAKFRYHSTRMPLLRARFNSETIKSTYFFHWFAATNTCMI